MIADERIEAALARLEELFVEQCKNGAQTSTLLPTGAACGQFLGAPENSQRGLHGTAAALLVLAQGKPEAASLVPKLVWYIENRDALIAEGKESPVGNHAFKDDQENVMKLSEALYALSYVQASQSASDSIISVLADKLLNAMKGDKGWAYFTDAAGTVDFLPSAFAILALTRHGYEQKITKEILLLERSVYNEVHDGSANINDSSVRIFCVFVLAFRKEFVSEEEFNRLRTIFVKLWRAHVSLFHDDVEQNLEYSREASNYYIRIPWQLYLLALAARLDPKCISSLAAQKKLKVILDAVAGSGFKYPYSGALLSSRTNAILFDVLQKIKRFNKRSVFHSMYHVLDRIRTFLGNRFFSFASLIIALLLGGFCLYAWIKRRANPEDLGQDLGGALVIMFITYFLERVRKHR